MFKRIKENPKVEKVRELWKNPKTHSLMVLGLWLVFIIIAILITKIIAIPQHPETQVENSNNFQNINNYEFTYQIDKYKINGQNYLNKTEFYLNNQRYYYNGNTYLIDSNQAILQPNFDINVLKINSQMLNNLTSNINPTENTEYRQYLIPLDRFINLYDIDTDMDLSKAMNYNIVLTLYTKDNTINKATIDLTSYRLLKTGNNEKYLLTIYFYNINNVSDFTKQYEKMIGGQL